MIDTHNHILFGIDDGSRDINESIKIAKKLSKLGFESIIATPHYIKDTTYTIGNKEKIKLLKKLEEETEKQNINMKYYLGNEIYITNDINDLVLNNKCRTLNNTRYILIEFPLDNFDNKYIDYIYDLTVIGYKVIIAHIERYTYFQKNFNEIEKLLEMDNVYIQCNYLSIVNKYGRKAKKLIKKLLQNNMVDLLGSDIHRENGTFFNNFKKSKKRIIKIIGEDKFNEITKHNPLNLLCDKNIKRQRLC